MNKITITPQADQVQPLGMARLTNPELMASISAESKLWHALADQLAKHWQGVTVTYGMEGFRIYADQPKVVVGQDDRIAFEFLAPDGQPQGGAFLPCSIGERPASDVVVELLVMVGGAL